MNKENSILTLSHSKLSLTGLTSRDKRIIGEAYESDLNAKVKGDLPKTSHINNGLNVIENILRTIDFFGMTIEAESVYMDAGVVTFKCQNSIGVPFLVRFEPGLIRKGNGLLYLINALEAKIVEYSIIGLRKNKIQISIATEEFYTAKNPLRAMFDEAYMPTPSEIESDKEKERILERIKELKTIRNSLLQETIEQSPSEEKKNII